MVAGSGSSELEAPTGAAPRLAAATGTAIPSIERAREVTRTFLADRRSLLDGVDVPEGFAVVLFGSSARGERTAESDDDWALVAGDEASLDGREAVLLARAGDVLGTDGHEPGSTGLFGAPFAARPLIEHVGLDEDTNTNTTRRMLLLLESVAVNGHAAHTALVDEVLGAYLAYGVRDRRPPRFLLNDIVRYWRTIGVDFEGKHWQRGGREHPKWIERNAKLRTSRKLLFVGGLLPVLACAARPADAIPAFLRQALDAPPLDRVAAAFADYDALDAGARFLAAYDRWLGLMDDADARAELASLTDVGREGSELFAEIARIGDVLDRSLITLLFETGLAPIAKRYAVL